MNASTEEQLLEINEMFKGVDEDNDGIISLEELKQVLESIFTNFTSHKISRMVNDADANGDGKICCQEFYKVLKRRSKKNKLLQAFKLFDTNGDGKISQEELTDVLKQTGGSISEVELTKMINDVDKDGDGYLSYNEFLNIMIK